jgi:hypothetical protein
LLGWPLKVLILFCVTLTLSIPCCCCCCWWWGRFVLPALTITAATFIAAAAASRRCSHPTDLPRLQELVCPFEVCEAGTLQFQSPAEALLFGFFGAALVQGPQQG